MISRAARFAGLVFVCLPLAAAADSGKPLRVETSGPTGELAKREQAKEIRVGFSDPMVELGRIPEKVEAPFFSIEPKVAGAFRWAGTKTLIFTPAAPLPWNTAFRVTIAGARSLAGQTLEKSYAFEFRTPRLHLAAASWYRKSGRFDSPVVLVLRYNQPVAAPTAARDLRVSYSPSVFTPPTPGAAAERWKASDPQGFAAFEARLGKAREAAALDGEIAISPARSWNKQWVPKNAETVVFETKTTPPAGSKLAVQSGSDRIVLSLEPVLFVAGLRCESACDPDDDNPLSTRVRVDPKSFAANVRVVDVTEKGKENPVPRRKTPKARAASEGAEGAEGAEEGDPESGLYPRSQEDWENRPEFWAGASSLDAAGYSLKPGRTYAVRVGAGLKSADGQTLGYSWIGEIENWHQSAFASLGAGHGVWEASGGLVLPFHARNLKTTKTWAALVKPGDLLATFQRLEKDNFAGVPGSGSVERTLAPVVVDRRLAPVPDKLQSYGLNLAPVLPSGKGVVWTAVGNGQPLARSHISGEGTPSSSLVQVTNLGLSVKDSPHNTLVFVTRLDDGRPVSGARVAIQTVDNPAFWSGTTDAEGIAIAPATRLRDVENWWPFRFLVTAEKDGDFAFVGSNWNQGIDPWSFDLNFRMEEALPLLRGVVFADRGVYKLGEEVRFKAVVRRDTPDGMKLLPRETRLKIEVHDSQGATVDQRSLAVSEWSAAEWAWKLPAEAPLGTYSVTARIDGDARAAFGSFLVAAFRRPDFRVDAEVSAAPGGSSIAGSKLAGTVTARYLFGAPMADKPVRWRWSRRPLGNVPAAVSEKFPEERWEFLGAEDDRELRRRRADLDNLETKEEKLDSAGQARLILSTRADSALPYDYTLEGEVTDVSRQRIAGRASFRVDPAPWYVGVRRLPFFADAGSSIETAIVTPGLDGAPVAGVKVAVRLVQVQWHAVRRAEGRGFYTWESQRKEVAAGDFSVTSGQEPVALSMPVPRGGFYFVRATAKDGAGHTAETVSSFYALGGGYTAWERYDHNRIDLVPEKATYRPGETARLLVKSPWEKATALLTTEREGVRTHSTFELTSTQQTVTVPISEDMIPNVFVSVLLVKGRTGSYTPDDASDPGKPSFRLGYAELKVENAAKRLSVSVEADRAEYRPGDPAKVKVAVADARGKGAPAEVTLWAVDYGVLSLTGYKTPDLLEAIWQRKGIAVLNEDSRVYIVSRRAIIPKGGAEGGGGGEEEGPGNPVRKDFRVLAFWLGSVVTDANGKASADVKLPESLTTYRIMAVAADVDSRFGRGEREILVRKPVLLRAAFPRFLTVGDRASFGAVLHSALKEKGTAVVTMKSLDPKLLEVEGGGKTSVEAGPGETPEIRFAVRAKAPGVARVNVSVRLGSEGDAFEEKIPIELVATPEVVAASGRLADAGPAREGVAVPAGVLPDYGGLRVELASTALVNLAEGAKYLVEYPYGCAEQRSSATLALLLAGDLGRAFRIPGIDADRVTNGAREGLAELPEFQCEGGGFAFWKHGCSSVSPYLTAYVVSVLQRGKALGYDVPSSVLDAAYGYLERELGQKAPENAAWMPMYLASQAFAAKVLADGGRNVDSPLNRLLDAGSLPHMPVFGLAYLWDALAASADRGGRPGVAADLRRRIENAILPENATAHVEEVADPALYWIWSTNVRSTAVVLSTFARHASDSPNIPKMVRWLLDARKNGRWGNTQENATSMGALVDYYKKLEAQVPSFKATARLAGKTVAAEKFEGRSAEARGKDTPMRELVEAAKARPSDARSLPLELEKSGTGTLFWSARLTYATAEPLPSPLDAGFKVERSYAVTTEGAAASTTLVPGTHFEAGALVRVTLTLRLPKERRYVAVTDPLPAGFEAVESWFATTASDLARDAGNAGRRGRSGGASWLDWWEHGGFDRVERHDDRVLLFATRLSEGEHTYSYLARATTAGTFQTAPARAEEMYTPEVFGRTASAVVEVAK